MLIKAILLGLVSLVAVVDSRLIGRQNIGRPLILSTLAGLVLGDMKQGIILGASLELMSMGFVAIGAAGPPNMQLGSVIATAFAILSGATTEEALSLAIPVFLAVYLGIDLVSNFVDSIPEVITKGLTVSGNLLSALGFAMLLSTMLSKKMFPYFMLGFLIVAYSGLDLVGVTLFAIILAYILDKVFYGKGANV